MNDNGALSKYVVNPEADMSETLVKTDSKGNTTYYIYGSGLIGEELQSGTYLIFHYDRRGSTIAVTDINGNTTDTYTYAPYGELVSHSGNNSIEFLFNGRDGVMTDSIGLYYMRSRYYNPEIKRFINMDVVRGSLSDTRTMNRFAYANGNPVSLVDPFGTSAQQAKYYENMGGLTEVISTIMVQFNMLLGITAMLGPVGFLMMPCLTMILDMMSIIVSAMSFDYFSMAQMEYNKLGDYADAERCTDEAYAALKNTIQIYVFTFVFPLVISKAGEAINDLRGSGFAKTASEDITKDAAEDMTKGEIKSVTYSPVNPGPLKQSIAETFTGATYTQKVLEEDTVFYRVTTNEAGKVGSYMSRTPQMGGMQSQLDLALNPEWGNTAQVVTKVTVPKGTVIYEGTAAPQVINGGAGILPGGGNQVYIPEVDPNWFK